MKKTYQLAAIAIAMLSAEECLASSNCYQDRLGNSYCPVNSNIEVANDRFVIANAMDDNNIENGTANCMMDALGSTICF